MRQILILLLFSFTSFPFIAQAFKSKDIEKIKAGELIVGLSGDATLDEHLKKAIEKFWAFKEIKKYLPLKEAIKQANADKNVYVLYVGIGKSIGQPDGQKISYQNISAALQIRISSGKFDGYAHLMPKVYTYIPVSEGNYLTQEMLYFGIAALQHICDVMMVETSKGTGKWKAIFNRYSDELKEKTIYLLDEWVEAGFSETDIKRLYPYPIKVVSYAEWSQAINTFQEDIAYCVVVPIPRAGTYLYIHYFMLASEAKILGRVYPMVTGSAQGFNLTKANNGSIGKKNVKGYRKLAH